MFQQLPQIRKEKYEVLVDVPPQILIVPIIKKAGAQILQLQEPQKCGLPAGPETKAIAIPALQPIIDQAATIVVGLILVLEIITEAAIHPSLIVVHAPLHGVAETATAVFPVVVAAVVVVEAAVEVHLLLAADEAEINS